MLCWTVHQKGSKRIHHAAVAVSHKVYSFGGYDYGETHTYNVGQMDVHVFNTVSLRWTKLLPSLVTVGSEGEGLLPSVVTTGSEGEGLLPSVVTVGSEGEDLLPSVVTVGSEGEDLLPSVVTAGSEGEELLPSVVTTGSEGEGLLPSVVTVGSEGEELLPSVVTTGSEGEGLLPSVVTMGSEGEDLLPSVVTTGSEGEDPLPPEEVPSMRVAHTAALLRDMVYIFGGIVNIEIEMDGSGVTTIRGDKCNALYAFNVDTHAWSEPRVHGSVPEARWGHSACVSAKVMYVFGGFNLTSGQSDDVHKLDTTAMVWTLINSRGTPQRPVSQDNCDHTVSQYHSATIIDTKMFVFGGQRNQDEMDHNMLRVFDTETNLWLKIPNSAPCFPEGRMGHSAFAYGGELYIFGGHTFRLERTFNDLWKFNPESLSWKRVEPKGKRPCWMSRMSCCMLGERVVLFGGYRYRDGASVPLDVKDDPEVSDDLYVLDLSPSLKTMCQLAVLQDRLEQSGLPCDVRWELEAMTTNQSNVR